MADDKTVIELIVEGAQRSVLQIQSVARAQTELVVVQESLGVRTRQVYGDIARAADEAAAAQERAAKRGEEAVRRAARAAEQASTRQRDPQGRFISREAELQREVAAQTAALSSGLQNPQRLQVAIDAAAFTAARNALVAQQAAAAQAAAQAATLQGRLQALGQTAVQTASNLLGLNRAQTGTAQATQQQAAAAQTQAQALRQLATNAQAAAAQQNVLTQAGQRTAASLLATAAAANRQANALSGLVNASSKATGGGITYLSVLSAIHAASFLSTNRTFSMVGSFLTLGLAFSKVGIAATGVGLAFGGLLAIFGQISQAAQAIQQATINGAVGLASLAAGAGVAAVAASGAAIKMAASVETQLAAVRAFGGATNDELEKVAAQADEFGARFGVASADVVEATSLFARAGGTVEEAIQGATEAIIRLQVASQGELTAAQAAIAVSAALKQFSLAGDQAVRVADNLTAAAQGSALSFAGVQQAFIQAAPGAAAMGITIEDLSAAIALLGNELIKGTTTGTAFKQFILDVVNPTDQAEKALGKYGVTFKDANGNALPFLDALEQLNTNMGEGAIKAGLLSKEQRATALTIAFGSRAFLAANILTKEGVTGLDEYRAALSRTTTSNIVDVLMLPLNKQLERLPVVAEQAGAAFGGPLLEPARSAVGQIIQFLQSIKPAAELAGQAVRVVLAGDGFGALQQKIAELVGNNSVSSFLIELVNVFRNVVDTILTTVVPAIQDFGKTLVDTFSQLAGAGTVQSAFDGINLSIRKVGAAAAVIIGNVASLTREFLLGVSTGGQLRAQLTVIATTVASQVVAAFKVMVVTLGAAVTAMPLLAQAAILTAKFVVALVNTVNGLRLAWERNIVSMKNTIDVLSSVGSAAKGNFAPIEGLTQRLEERNKESEKLQASIVAENQALNTVVGSTDELLVQLNAVAADFGKATQGTEKQQAAMAILGKTVEELADEIAQARAQQLGIPVELFDEEDRDRFIAQAHAMKMAAKTDANGVVSIYEELQGQLGTIFDNITAEVEQRTRDLNNSPSGTAPGGIGGPDQAELDKVKNRIDEAGRDIQRRLENLAQDSAQKVTNLIQRSLERLDDIRQNAVQRIGEIQDAVEERIRESRRTTAERREDRDRLDAFKKDQEDRFTEFQRGLDRQALADQRALDDRQRRRAQDNEDFARSTEQQFQDEETLQQRRLAIVQRAFDQIQQVREQAFDRSQQAELTAFQRSQQAAAEARQFSLQLAKATTPEDKLKLTQQRQEQLRDTRFQQSQEDQLTKFRQRQEEAKQTFARSQESEAIGFRQGLEDRFTAFRRQQETSLIKFRRGEEIKELRERRKDEDAMLQLRLDNEDIIQARRRADQAALQREQDTIENQRNTEEEQRIRDRALADIDKAIANAEKLAGEVIDKLGLDLAEQAADVNRQLRNVIQTLIDLQDQVPPELFGPYAAALARAREQAEGVEAALIRSQDAAQLQVAQAKAVNTAELITAAQQAKGSLLSLVPSTPPVNPLAQKVPGQVLSLQTMQVSQLVMPMGFSREVATAVQLGIQLAAERGLIPSTIDIDIIPITDRLDRIGRSIG